MRGSTNPSHAFSCDCRNSSLPAIAYPRSCTAAAPLMYRCNAAPLRRLLREFRYFQLPTAAVFADQPLSLARVYAVGGSTDIHMHRPVGTVMCYDTNFDGWCVEPRSSRWIFQVLYCNDVLSCCMPLPGSCSRCDVAELPAARACFHTTGLRTSPSPSDPPGIMQQV